MLYEATFDIIKGRKKHRFPKENLVILWWTFYVEDFCSFNPATD